MIVVASSNLLRPFDNFPNIDSLEKILENSSKTEQKSENNFRSIPGRDTDRFLENSSKYGRVFQKSV